MADPITRTQLENASEDADHISAIANGSATSGPDSDGIVPSRLGTDHKTLSRLVQDFTPLKTLAFETVAALEAYDVPDDLAIATRAEVTADILGDVEDGNGIYSWSGTAWVWISDLIPQSVEDDLDEIREEIATPLAITSFTTTPSAARVGSTTAVTLDWTLSKDGTEQSIDNSIGVVTPDSARTVSGGSKTTTTTYVLTVENGIKTVTASATVTFLPDVFWGVSDNSTLTESQIEALSNSALASGRARSFTLDGGTSPGKYLYYAYPATFGDPSVYRIFGFDETYVKTTVSITNTHGVTANYTVLRSLNKVIGSAPVEVQ